MSTKIYNGLRITETDFHKLSGKIYALRLQIMDKVREKKANFIANYAVIQHDRKLTGYIYKDEEPETEPYFAALSHLMKADEYCYDGGNSRTDQYAHPDYTFELSIFAYKGAFYAMPFTEDRDLEALLLSQPWIEEFGYWDNTDKPDSISVADWKKRQRIWQGIFDRCYASAPANGDFQVNLSPRLWEYPDWDKIALFLPDFDKRLTRRAEEIAHEVWSSIRYQELKAKYDGKEPPIHEFMLGFGSVRKTDPQWNRLIEEETVRLRTLLPEIITPQMLGVPEHRLSKEISV
ncbi:hypothetical protein [Brucella anthropi]|uniref:hypothetical protein n=1 Tax=Brucella anthropi TaxID=529 RepID=UPI000F668FBD|nr:hypothetical protein [Brucella anthropi]RRY03861.1 hypothetical protein EGJ58_22435 [Brucella anthropi]